MKYKIGDKVVLRDSLKTSDNLEEHYTNDMEYLKHTAHTIEEVTALNNYVIDDWFVTGDMIDHEKTAELNDSECMSKFLYGDTLEEMTPEVSKWADKEEVLERYTDELEKTAAEKNEHEAKNVDDAIRPAHYRQGNIDRIEVWYQTYPFDGFRWAMKSHIDKYIHRYESKGGIEDLDKATYFIKRLKEKELNL